MNCDKAYTPEINERITASNDLVSVFRQYFNEKMRKMFQQQTKKAVAMFDFTYLESILFLKMVKYIYGCSLKTLGKLSFLQI